MSTSKWDQRRAEREARLNLLGEIEERAAIMEYDGKLLRETAERLAMFDFITCHENAFKNYEEILSLLKIKNNHIKSTYLPVSIEKRN